MIQEGDKIYVARRKGQDPFYLVLACRLHFDPLRDEALGWVLRHHKCDACEHKRRQAVKSYQEACKEAEGEE